MSTWADGDDDGDVEVDENKPGCTWDRGVRFQQARRVNGKSEESGHLKIGGKSN